MENVKSLNISEYIACNIEFKEICDADEDARKISKLAANYDISYQEAEEIFYRRELR